MRSQGLAQRISVIGGQRADRVGLGTPLDGIFWEEVDKVVRQFETDEVQCGDLAFLERAHEKK